MSVAGLYKKKERAQGDFVTVCGRDGRRHAGSALSLPELYETLCAEDYDCAATRRVTREGEPAIRSFFARLFYRLINRISDTEIVDGARDFRLMKRRMVDAILSMREVNRFSKGIFGWVGFRTKWIPFRNVQRSGGRDEMVFLEAVPLFRAGHSRVFHRSSCHCVGRGCVVLPGGVCHDRHYRRQNIAFWRSGRRLALSGVHRAVPGRRAAFLHRYPGAVSGKDVSGNKAQANLYSPGKRAAIPTANTNKKRPADRFESAGLLSFR